MDTTATSGGGVDLSMKQLHGKYKSFFKTSMHKVVEQWYNSKETGQHRRRNMKTLVKAILDFDATSAKSKLRATDRADVIGANAIYDQHNGPLLFSDDASEKAVQWLSFATKSQKQMFRDTFGHMKPASLFSSSRQYDDDFKLENKVVPSDARTAKPRGLKGTQYAHKISEPITSETLVIGKHPTVTGTNFVWKVQPQLSLNIQQRAHDASFQGAPWGDYGKEKTSNQTQWQTKTKEDFQRTQYDGAPERDFQNYNENYCTELYKSAKKAAKVEKMRAEVEMFRASQMGMTNPQESLRAGGTTATTNKSVNFSASPVRAPSLGTVTEGHRPASMMEVGMNTLLTQERKYKPKLRAPVSAPSYRNQDTGDLLPEFVETAKRIRQTNYPLMHTAMKRRKMHMTQYHSRE